MTKVVIFIPGIMGTQLYKDGQLVWPGPLHSLVLPYPYIDMLLDPDLVVGDIIRTFSLSEQYDFLVMRLSRAGFTESSGTLRMCPFDWRKRNEDAAEKLAGIIDKVSADYNGDVEITLLAHSMGGLVARYYLESALYTDRLGFCRIRNLFTMGTPHRGAPLALTAAMGYEKRLFLSHEQVRKVAEHPDFPSLYQLLPLDDAFVWDDRDRSKLFCPFPIMERSENLGLVPDNLEAARRFRARLTGVAPAGVRYFCFIGTQMRTLAHVRITGNDGALQVLRAESEGGGDGTVPSWSGGLNAVQNLLVGGEHGTIYKNAELLRALGGLLGVKNTLAAGAPETQIAMRDKVVVPGQMAHLTITFPISVRDVNAELVVERVSPGPGNSAKKISVERYPIRYVGAGATRFDLTIPAPKDPSLYNIRLEYNHGPGSVQDDFFVQDTLE